MGGAGTVSQGLRAGVPNLIVPFFGDQFFWAKAVQQLGVGYSIPANKLTADRFSTAAKKCVAKECIQKASGIGFKIRKESEGCMQQLCRRVNSVVCDFKTRRKSFAQELVIQQAEPEKEKKIDKTSTDKVVEQDQSEVKPDDVVISSRNEKNKEKNKSNKGKSGRRSCTATFESLDGNGNCAIF